MGYTYSKSDRAARTQTPASRGAARPFRKAAAGAEALAGHCSEFAGGLLRPQECICPRGILEGTRQWLCGRRLLRFKVVKGSLSSCWEPVGSDDEPVDPSQSGGGISTAPRTAWWPRAGHLRWMAAFHPATLAPRSCSGRAAAGAARPVPPLVRLS